MKNKKNTFLVIYMIIIALLNVAMWIGVPLASKMDEDITIIMVGMSALSLFMIYHFMKMVRFNKLMSLYDNDYDSYYMVTHSRRH